MYLKTITMHKRAIKVDLSIFFDDERKMAFILVDPNWESVACLQRRVERVFDIDSVRFISDGCFLPPQESIEIIQFCNDLKAFVPKESLEKRKIKSKKCKTTDISVKCECEETIYASSDKQQQKKRKSDCLQTSHSQNDLPHIPKRLNIGNMNLYFEIPNSKEMPQSLHVDNHEVKSTLSKNIKLIRDYEECEEENRGVKSQIKETNCASTPKAMQRPAIADDNLEKAANEEMETGSRSDIPSSLLLNNSKLKENRNKMNNSFKPLNPSNSFTNSKSNGGHSCIYECGEIVNCVTKAKSNSSHKRVNEGKTLIIFRCPLSDVTNGTKTQNPRVFHLKSENIPKSKISKQIVEIQDDLILPPHPTQKTISELNLTNYQTIESGVVGNQKETSESTEDTNGPDFFNTNNLLYCTIATATSTTDKNYQEEQVSGSNLELSRNQESNVTEEQNESQMELTNTDGDVTEAQNKSQVEVTHVYGNVTDIKDESELELKNIDENVGGDLNNSQIEQKKGGISLAQVDCVDLSIDIEEEVTSEENVKEKHDLTAEDESYIEEISEIIDLNESEDNYNYKCNNSSQRKSSVTNKDLTDIKIKKILPFCSDLTVLPTAEDVLIFKVSYVINKSKVNCTTNFMAGKVEHVNKRTKAIQILVIDGVSELRKVPTHFIFSNMDNSLNSSLDGRHLKVKLTDLREVKLFSKIKEYAF